jgi:hypothetical protein
LWRYKSSLSQFTVFSEGSQHVPAALTAVLLK